MTAEQLSTLDGFVDRRLRREPTSRILGRKGFWKILLNVTPDVLSPRPDTEALLDVVLAEGFLEEVRSKGLLLKQGLAGIADDFPQVVEGIRGVGLMAGLKCGLPNTEVNTALRAQHLLAAPAGDNVIRLLPPLIADDEEIRTAVDRIRTAAANLAAAEAAA